MNFFDDVCYRYIYSDEQYLTYCKERSPLVRYAVNKKAKIKIYINYDIYEIMIYIM